MKYPDLPQMFWRTKSGGYWGAKPWNLCVPQYFQQSYDLGAPVAARVAMMQQAWRSIHLVFTPCAFCKSVLTFCKLQTGAIVSVRTLRPPPFHSPYYQAQRRVLHDRQVNGPTVTAGWSSYVASESEVVSQPVLLLGASGTCIYNTGRSGASRGVVPMRAKSAVQHPHWCWSF